MAREKKKGTSGNAKAFITRAKALKKLQLTLPEFRRLCILKGIYPRNPRKKVEGSDKTYYLRKDIDFLAHERLISTIRHQNAHKKKVVKARAKRRLDILKQLALNTPRARLDHLVVERYPHFEDALRELDDPLCIIALFGNLPGERKIGISPHKVANCQRLLREFCHFVVETCALKRVFVSIKGYYYQAQISGVNVTWITPHRFTQLIPRDIDFSVMLTFLELYECILSFVNFRLYTGKNLAYPPKINHKAAFRGLELSSLVIENISEKDKNAPAGKLDEHPKSETKLQLSKDVVKQAERIAMDAANEEEDDDDESNGGIENNIDVDVGDVEDVHVKEQNNDEESSDEEEGEEEEEEEEEKGSVGNENEAADEIGKVKSSDGSSKALDASMSDVEREEVSNYDDLDTDTEGNDENEYAEDDLAPSGVFAQKSIVLGREVPFVELEFVLKASGASRVTREDDLSEGNSRLAGYTHWIIDRPAVSGVQDMTLEYVQPQYVFDSVNAGLLLPTSLYAPGAHLPPHLSPFVSRADDGGYKPWFQDVLERIKDGDTSVVAEAAAVVYKEGEAITKKAEKASEARRSKTKHGEVNDARMKESVEEANGQQAYEDDAKIVDKEETIGDNESESEDNYEKEIEEKDSEGEEERIGKEKQDEMDKEGKEMATLMLSRKKLRKYKKAKGQEMRREAIKQKLTEKRRKLDEEHANLTGKRVGKRRKV